MEITESGYLKEKRGLRAAALVLGLLVTFAFLFAGAAPKAEKKADVAKEPYYMPALADEEGEDGSGGKRGFIKWADFNVPYGALDRALSCDIKSQGKEVKIDWIELLSLLAVKYYGNWNNYKPKDMDAMAAALSKGEPFEKLRAHKHYPYYSEVYRTVLGEFVGKTRITIEQDEGLEPKVIEKYGLKAFLPVAEGFGYSDCDDFGNRRGYGFVRKHLGHDMMGAHGTPIIAVEGGYVEVAGWNQYGGWRIGIRSHDKKRYYYYAHLRKDKPFQSGITEGAVVNAGDVIGYMGRTGYSRSENTNNIKTTHLHWGLQLVFDESQKEALSEIWLDVYGITRLLSRNRSTVVFNPETKEYTRKHKIEFL